LDPADKPARSLREVASTFYVDPRKASDLAWAFASRAMFVLAYAFLTTYQAYYLPEKIGSAEAEVPRQIFLGTLVQSLALFVIARAGDVNGFLDGMAIAGLGFGMYMAVDRHSSPTCCRTRTTPRRTSACSTSPAPSRRPSRRRSPRPSFRPAAAATASCTRWPASAPLSGRRPPCP
jgi:hypothetical protein